MSNNDNSIISEETLKQQSEFLSYIILKLNNDATQIESQAKNPTLSPEQMHNGMDLAKSLRITSNYLSGNYFKQK